MLSLRMDIGASDPSDTVLAYFRNHPAIKRLVRDGYIKDVKRTRRAIFFRGQRAGDSLQVMNVRGFDFFVRSGEKIARASSLTNAAELFQQVSDGRFVRELRLPKGRRNPIASDPSFVSPDGSIVGPLVTTFAPKEIYDEKEIGSRLSPVFIISKERDGIRIYPLRGTGIQLYGDGRWFPNTPNLFIPREYPGNFFIVRIFPSGPIYAPDRDELRYLITSENKTFPYGSVSFYRLIPR